MYRPELKEQTAFFEKNKAESLGWFDAPNETKPWYSSVLKKDDDHVKPGNSLHITRQSR